MISTCVLGLGSNLGDSVSEVNAAIEIIRLHPEIHVESISSLYQTSPVGKIEQPDFINAVCILNTTLSPEALLAFCLEEEQRQGRIRNERWGPRIIDIDILMYQDVVCQLPDLILPHPELLNRSFWLIPLFEIAPNWVLPNGQMVEHYVREWDVNSIRKI